MVLLRSRCGLSTSLALLCLKEAFFKEPSSTADICMCPRLNSAPYQTSLQRARAICDVRRVNVFSYCHYLFRFPDPDNQPSQISKRSTDDLDDSSASCKDSSSNGASAVQKRFNEFVGKRAQDDIPADKRYEFVGKRSPYEFVGKRPYEFLGKRGVYEFLGKRPYEFVGKRPYEFLGKRSPYEFVGKRPYEFLGKRSPYEFVGKRPYEFLGKRNLYEFIGKRPSASVSKRTLVDFYGKRVELPYEFVGKRIFGSAWERVSSNTVEGDKVVSDFTDAINSRSTSSQASKADAARGVEKRYSEWLGKRGGQLSDQLLRELVNKRISSMMRNRLQNGANPEFIGRREEKLPQQDDRQGMKKRYTEFIGK